MNRSSLARVAALVGLTLVLPWLMGAAAPAPADELRADGDIQLVYGRGGYQSATCGGVKRTQFEEAALRVQATVPAARGHQVGLRIDLGTVSESSDFKEMTDDGRERNYSEGKTLWGLRAGLVWEGPWAGAMVGWQYLGTSSLASLSARFGSPRLHLYAGMLDGGATGALYDGLGILWSRNRVPVWLSRVGIGASWPGLGLSGQFGLTSLDVERLAEVTLRRHTAWGAWLLSARMGQLDPDWQLLFGLSMPLFATEAQKAAAPF